MEPKKKKNTLKAGGINILNSIKNQDEKTIEKEFEELMSSMGIEGEHREDMRRLSYDKKEQLLNSKKNMDKLEKKKKKHSMAPEEYRTVFMSAKEPIMDTSLIIGLRVYLATSPLEWAERFIDGEGIEGLLKYMSLLNISPTTNHTVGTQELELVRCLQALINISKGVKKIFSLEMTCQTLCLSIDGLETETRHLVSQLLTFACHHNDESYSMVIKGFEHLWKVRKSKNAFDVWVSKLLESADAVLDLRVKGNEEDSLDLEECLLSNFILVNSLISTNPSLNMRVACRDELEKSGFNEVIEKTSTFKNSLMEYQISKYENEGLEDAMGIEEEYSRFVTEEVISVEQAADTLINRVISPDDREDLLTIFKDLLLVTPEKWSTINPLNKIKKALPSIINTDPKHSYIGGGFQDKESSEHRDNSGCDDLVSRMSSKFDRDQELDIFQSVIDENKDLKSRLNKAQNELKLLNSQVDEKSGK
ncbi:Formin-F [Smittium culicis]|uniref:Formin-F n=1 Tax=Smittium culicis TaxID=133412 RepID=A0A1R1YRI6_9FUNG|nr:Formin-F [Smittium culicis]